MGNPAPQTQSAQPASPHQVYKQLLQQTIREKQLQAFYPPTDSQLDQAAAVAAAHIDHVCEEWGILIEVGRDLAKLALFDIVLYIDNSGSMACNENGKRIEELRMVVSYVISVVRLFDADGFAIRFMNGPKGDPSLDNVCDEATMNRYLNNSSLFHGITPLGTELRNQVLNDIVSQARARRLPKPVLVITITDGIPFGEPKSVLRDAILFATTEVARTKYGPGAISFQFAQVGNDMDAQAFLEELDSDPKIGHLVDCTSNMKQESAQMLRANPSVVLTEPLWVLKMLLGAIDSSYDTQDEVTFGPSIQSYVPPPAQEDTHETSSQQQGTRQAGPPGPPPSYSLEPPQQPAHGQQGYADTSSPQQQGRRSIFHRSKEALGRVRSFRGSKGA